MRNKKTKKMVLFSMLLAIEVILSFTPLGFYASVSERYDAAHPCHHLRDGTGQTLWSGPGLRDGILLVL